MLLGIFEGSRWRTSNESSAWLAKVWDGGHAILKSLPTAGKKALRAVVFFFRFLFSLHAVQLSCMDGNEVIA